MRQFCTDIAKAIIAELSHSWGLINMAGVFLGAVVVVYWDTMIAMGYNLGLAYIDGNWHENFALLAVPRSAPGWESLAIFCVFWPPCLVWAGRASESLKR